MIVQLGFLAIPPATSAVSMYNACERSDACCAASASFPLMAGLPIPVYNFFSSLVISEPV